MIREERQRLAQKYGYKLPDSSKFSPLFHLRKDPRQIFYGLEPGWLINLKDQTILKPTDEKFQTFYHSWKKKNIYISGNFSNKQLIEEQNKNRQKKVRDKSSCTTYMYDKIF